MHKKFDSETIEKKWQKKWKESGIYNVEKRDQLKEKEYVLVELPYPSGNLHIGHWHAFAVPDIYVRFGRMQGKQMLYPMGFDAFGLPAENAAIKRNSSPKEWTEGNIEYMKGQLESMGASFSWDKTTSTTDENYYKWTQWMFTKFFEKDIAYKGVGIVNWCTDCNTVIANEQVLSDDTCERCGTTIERREMPQWMLRITNYADRLVDDLDTLTEWPEHIKEAQRQWIGRSQGAEIPFKLSTDETVGVFTTRPDTLFGATYIVLAPEITPKIIKKLDSIKNWEAVSAYINATKQKTEQDRLDDTKEKTGIELEGITATNPANGKEIPVYIADYVLANYGTGAIMAVPAHDKRDFDFAEKFNINKICVIQSNLQADNGKMTHEITDVKMPYEGAGILIHSSEFDGINSEEAKSTITEKVGGTLANTYRLRDWSVGRQRYWGVPIPIVYDPEGNAHTVPEEHLPWILPEDVDFRPTGEPPLAKSTELKKRTEKIFGEGWTPEVETLDTFVDSSWYFLRYLDTENTDCAATLKAQKDWMPVDVYFGGAEHTTMHLLYSRFWQKALMDLGYVAHNEPYTKRINRGLILGPDGNKMSKSKGNVINPDEHVKRVGADSVKMYLAFMGPYGEPTNYPWDMGGIAGIRRFLERANGLTEHITDTEPKIVTKQLHKTIQKITKDIPEYKFNTAISSMMIFINLVEKESITKNSYLIFLKSLAPFAPHLTEELWEQAGNTSSVHLESFPEYDENLAMDELVTIGVQINGKMRGSITLARDETEEKAMTLVKNDATLEKRIKMGTSKIIYIPNRIINIISK